jgi:hypothetical protein
MSSDALQQAKEAYNQTGSVAIAIRVILALLKHKGVILALITEFLEWVGKK